MKYIAQLTEGERINEIYLCRKKQSALTKAGKPYESLMLQDKTGTLDAKIWDPGSLGIDDFDELDYIAVTGGCDQFPGGLSAEHQATAESAAGGVFAGGLSALQ